MSINDSLISEAEPIRRRTLVMIIVVDVSGSMDGVKIGSVNTSLEELMPELANVGEADAEIKVAVLTFSDVCKWLTPAAVPPEELTLTPMVADGTTCLGDACLELNKRMSRKDLLNSPGSSYAPILILMSDGEPTDNYLAGLEELKKNKWYDTASKYAIPIGTDASIEALAAFTGNKEAVLKPATRSADLIKKIKKVALESATFATRSHTGDVEKTRAEQTLENIQKAVEDDDDDSAWMDGGSAPVAGGDPTNLGVTATVDPGEEW